MGNWQGIETAPRDGTRLLLWDAKRGVAVSGLWYTDPGRDDPSGYDPGGSWWAADDDVLVWDDANDEAPTHWMPFSEPPQQ